ncbi:DUF488 domain-containing protein [Nitratireductor mangrovi]|uniref:DUF488 domain-containing protein n=1 Tax=Nitratireductor mangrovi TaxID=2599600 RepID=A0A5B8KX28_9HYPH|nr:DUF488 domain-containing protein [Nitratireductor mangrovi]QDZ00234.1 DUF488 domain-containing protein [Nitratireductor mangrovi]
MIEAVQTGSAAFTIGHSNRTLPTFKQMLLETSVDLVVDVRRFPGSRSNPSFNAKVLTPELQPHGIGYTHCASLGGLRSKVADIPSEENGFWNNRSFHNYADFARTDEFQSALLQLLGLCREHRCALMCAEAVWWRCHRRIIADHLIARGISVFHIMDIGKCVRAHLSDGAVIDPDLRVRYPGQ